MHSGGRQPEAAVISKDQFYHMHDVHVYTETCGLCMLGRMSQALQM